MFNYDSNPCPSGPEHSSPGEGTQRERRREGEREREREMDDGLKDMSERERWIMYSERHANT